MSAQIKTKIVSIIRSDFDQTPKYWEGAGWYDNAEEVADDIIALFSSPAPVAVEELVARLGKAYAWARKDGGRPALSLLTEAATALSTLAADKARIEAERDALLAEMRAEPESYPNLLRINREYATRCENERHAAEARALAVEAERDALREALAAEREACAVVAESLPGQRGNSPEHLVGNRIAQAIRARALKEAQP